MSERTTLAVTSLPDLGPRRSRRPRHGREWLMQRTAVASWPMMIALLVGIGTEDGRARVPLAASLGVGAMISALALTIPWEHPRIRTAAWPAFAAITAIVPVELSLRAWDMHYGIVLALPIMWLALHSGGRQLVTGMALVGVACVTPYATGQATLPHVPAFDLLTIVVAVSVGFVTHRLAEQSRRRAAVLALAYTDALTGLPNRRAWDERLPVLLARAAIERRPVSVLVLDLDGFADLNDDLGHAAADQILHDVATAWRSIACDDGVLMRYGADEFAVALEDCTAAEAGGLAERLRKSTPGGHSFSAGVAAWDGREDAKILQARVMTTMNAVRRAAEGSPGLTVVATTVAGRPWSRLAAEAVARSAIEPVYQPILRLSDRALVGHEALARPAGADPNLPVDELFHEARRLGLGRDLELLCLDVAIRGAGALPQGDLFVNVGAGALRSPEATLAIISAALEAAGRETSWLVLEVSETVSRLRRFESALNTLRSAGLRLALDDVGDAHSSLEALAVVRLDFVKIARSLSTNLQVPAISATVRALVEYARATGCAIIAEGIETAPELEQLAGLGIALGQGYVLGRPRRAPVAAADNGLRVAG